MSKKNLHLEKINIKYFAFLIAGFYLCSLIPILCVSIYDYPQADDWGYSYLSYWAWNDTHSFIQVLKAAAGAVTEAYSHWQGTFSSIFLMALQPGIFGEQFYAAVPFIMLGLLSFSVTFFFIELCKLLKSNKYIGIIFSAFTLLVIVQCMICKPVAFFWYNAAVHYIVAFCFALILVGCLINLYRREKMNWWAMFGASIFSIMLGGGNLVTALSGIIGFVTLFVLLIVYMKKRMLTILIIPASLNFIAFGINVMAPGNQLRQAAAGVTANPIISIFRSLFYGIYYLGDIWLNWQVILFVLILIPFAWLLVQNVQFHFPVPWLVSIYSYCFLSAMFTPVDYAANTVDIGRVQNVIFTSFIIILSLNVIYFTGWLYKNREKKLIKCQDTQYLRGMKVKYVWGLCVAALLIVALVSIPSPEKFTTVLAIHELRNGIAREYGEVALENIQILKNSTEDSVTIWKVPRESALLTSEDIDQWQYDTKNYFRKKQVIVSEKNNK